jgi:molybdopterin synthase sulfur carrier subunit
MADPKIRMELPFHLQNLAGCGQFVEIAVAEPVTLGKALLALERTYPTLSGAVIDPYKGTRRPLVRFYACRQDLSFGSMDQELPAAVVEGKEELLIIGAISGG